MKTEMNCFKKGDKMKKINTYEKYNINDINLDDLIVLMSANIENAYIKAGIKDYSAKDCFEKGYDLAKNIFLQKNTKISFDLEF